MKRYLPLIMTILLPLGAFGAKEGYKITFQANGNQDTMMLLCYYHANNRYITDTAFNNGKGRYVFEDKKKELKPGPMSKKLFDTLRGIQYGEIEDKHGWTTVVIE